MVAGDNTKTYLGLNFVGTDFLSSPIDAVAMTRFGLDVHAPTDANFTVKLAAFPDGGTTGWRRRT